MLKIGELAELVGVTQRTIRHYHQVGLLPEPERDSSGYRSYGMDDVVRLIRIRRLASLGLSLAEVAGSVEAGGEADLKEVLADLDADLARREREIGQQRQAIARLLDGGDPDLSPALAAALHELSAAVDPDIIERERDAARLLEHAMPAHMAAGLADFYGRIAADPDLTALLAGLSRRFMVADDADAEALADEFAEVIGDLVGELPDGGAGDPTGHLLGELMTADLTPVQRRVVDLVIVRLQRRAP